MDLIEDTEGITIEDEQLRTQMTKGLVEIGKGFAHILNGMIGKMGVASRVNLFRSEDEDGENRLFCF